MQHCNVDTCVYAARKTKVLEYQCYVGHRVPFSNPGYAPFVTERHLSVTQVNIITRVILVTRVMANGIICSLLVLSVMLSLVDNCTAL